MNRQATQEQSFGFEIPDWKRVRVPTEVERLATVVVDSIFAVHKELGPGLLVNFNEVLIKHGIHHILNVPRSREEVLT